MPVPGQSSGPVQRQRPFTYDPGNQKDAWLDERQRAQEQGDYFDQGFRDRGDSQLDIEEQNRQQADRINSLIEEGYSPEEAQQIIRQEDLQRLELDPQERNNRFLTEGEQGGITGDPYDAIGKYFNPNYYDELTGEGNKRLGEATQMQGTRIGETTRDLKSGVQGSIDPVRLRQDPEYRARVLGELERGGGSATRAVNDPGLDITQDYLENRGYSDEDVAAFGEKGARDVGTRYQSAITDLERQAAAAGYSDPMALAAARSRLENQSAVGASDAALNAQLKALEMQKGATQQIQDTQLGAAGTRAGLRSNVALNLLGQKTSALSDMERSRISAEQGLTDYNLRGTGMIADQSMRGTLAQGDAERSDAMNIRDTSLSGQRWTTGTGLQYGTGAEQEASDRGGRLALNRQGTESDVQGERFDRGLNINNQLSSRFGRVADTRLGEGSNARAYRGGQQQYAGGNYAESVNDRMRNREMTTNDRQYALEKWQVEKNKPGIWSRVLNAGLGAAAGFATGGWGGAIAGGLGGALGGPQGAQQGQAVQRRVTGGGSGGGFTAAPRGLPDYGRSYGGGTTLPNGDFQVRR